VAQTRIFTFFGVAFHFFIAGNRRHFKFGMWVGQITACTVAQAVVKANSQSNGKGQISTPWGSETPERILMKLGIYNQVAGLPTHANPCGAATTWVVWANT